MQTQIDTDTMTAAIRTAMETCGIARIDDDT